MNKAHRLTLSFFLIAVIVCSAFLFQSTAGDLSSGQPSPVVAIQVSEYTQTHWSNPSWTYVSTYRMLEEAFKADGTPFIEVSDAAIESGALLTSAGTPKYPILFSLATECISNMEAVQINSYVSAGGFAYVGSSAFTRNSDGEPRTDFALSSQMGVACSASPPNNWGLHETVIRVADNRLVDHVPANAPITWRLPLTDHSVPSLDMSVSDPHYAWTTKTAATNPAQVLMTIDGNVMLATKPYSNGRFIYHSELAPLAAFSVYSPLAYEYVFFRQAVEWAFENQHLPLARLSAWPYQYNSAFVARHDMDLPVFVNWIASSAATEKALGVTGQYYIVTGDVRDAPTSGYLISLIQQAQSLGAQIGSHNGGLNCTPWDPTLTYNDYGYYHWGPDNAMQQYPTGEADGLQYANGSITLSFNDLENWLGYRPQIWVSPNGQGVWEESYQLIDSLGIATSGEFTPSPYPGFVFSVANKTKYYNNFAVPFSRWISSSGVVCQSMEELSWYAPNDMQALVDFYYNMGALVSPYSHSSSESGLPRQFLQDVLAKPYMWSTSPVELRNWDLQRQRVNVTQQFEINPNGINNLTLALTGSVSPDTAIDIVLPLDQTQLSSLQVLLNGVLTSNYRLTECGFKVQAGMASTVTLLYSTGVSESWAQTTRADFKLGMLTGVDADTVPGQLTITPTMLFSDDFSNAAWTSNHWIVRSGSWTVNNGYYNMVSQAGQMSIVYAGDWWSDFALEARVRYVTGEYSGEIGARLDPNTGSRYSFMIYPSAPVGPNIAALYRFNSWTDTEGTLLGEALIATDTDWHNLRMEMVGSEIKCFYDGSLIINVVDSSYASGLMSLESFGDTIASYDWVKISSLSYSSGTLLSVPFDSGSQNMNWTTISWMASVPAGTTLQFRSRTAPNQTALASAAWSSYYTVSGSIVTSPPNRWIQYEATLATSNGAVTPVLYGLTLQYSYPMPDGTVQFTLNMGMTAAIEEPTYDEATVTNPIETSWVASNGTLYAGVGSTVYRSDDQGENWQTLKTFSSGEEDASIDSIYVDSRNYTYASPDSGAAQSELGLWRSTDWGQTWTLVLALPPSCSIWSVDEDSNGKLFAGVYTTGNIVSNARIYRSTDGGATWTSVYYGGPSARHIHDVAVDKTNNWIYASIGDKYLGWNSWIVRSRDGGDTWEQILNGCPQVWAIEVVPGARLFGTDDPMSGNGRILRTTDDHTLAIVKDTGVDSYGNWFRTNSANGVVYASFVSGEQGNGTAWIFASDNNGLNWSIYRTFYVSPSNWYFGSPWASNFVDGVMYYSVLLDSGWQNGVKIFSNNENSALTTYHFGIDNSVGDALVPLGSRGLASLRLTA